MSSAPSCNDGTLGTAVLSTCFCRQLCGTKHAWEAEAVRIDTELLRTLAEADTESQYLDRAAAIDKQCCDALFTQRFGGLHVDPMQPFRQAPVGGVVRRGSAPRVSEAHHAAFLGARTPRQEGSPPWSTGVPGISQPVGRISEGSVWPDDGFSRARDERWQEQVSPRRAVGSWRGAGSSDDTLVAHGLPFPAR